MADFQVVSRRMPSPLEWMPPDKCFKIFYATCKYTSSQIHMLKEKAIVLFTPDQAPPRDVIVEWVDSVLVKRLATSMEHVRALSCSTFLIVMDFPLYKAHILAPTPLFDGHQIVLALPWTLELQIQAL